MKPNYISLDKFNLLEQPSLDYLCVGTNIMLLKDKNLFLFY